MKKLIIAFVLLLAVCMPIFSSTIYEVETKSGTQQVIIPDGYTEKDVLLILAKAYYDLNTDYDKLAENVKDLSTQVETYIAKNQELRQEYDKLIDLNQQLTEKLETKAKLVLLRPLFGGGVGYDPLNKSIAPSIIAGAELLEKLQVFTMVQGIIGKQFVPVVSLGVTVLL